MPVLILALGILLAGAATAHAGPVQALAASGDFAGLVEIGGGSYARIPRSFRVCGSTQGLA